MATIAETTKAGAIPANTALLLALLVTAQVTVSCDFSLASVALPSIERGLNIGPTLSQWVITGDLLAYAGFLIVGGRLADRFGQKRILMLGLALFMAGSILTSLSINVAMLIAARMIQGVGGALTYPSALSLLTISYPEGPLRFRAYTINLAAQAVGVPCATIVAGAAITRFGWQSAFLLNVPLCGILLALLPRIRAGGRIDRGGTERIPFRDAMLLTLGVAGLVYALTGFVSPLPAIRAWAPISLAIGLVILLIFGLIQRHASAPLIPGALLRTPNLIGGVITAAFMVLISKAFVVLSNISLQKGLHVSPLTASLALLPLAISSPMLIPISARAGRYLLPYAKTAICAAFLALAGFYGLLSVANRDTAFPLMLGMLFLHPFASMTGVNLTLSVTLRNVPDDAQGVASAIIYTAAQMVSAIGMALVIAASGHPGAGVDDFRRFGASFETGAAICLFGLILTALVLRNHSRSAT